MAFAMGENVGPYRILIQLGQGGMATVFKAYHAGLDRYVAIKVLHRAFMEDPNFLARFQREARLVAKLEHPNIVPVHDFAQHAGQPYLVMRFIEGETLKARLARGPLTRDELVRIVDAVAAGLTYAHRQGVLHRDIKPSNILLEDDGDVYLADFGLARIAVAGESTLSTDMLMGTPHYISPEQARGERDLDERTDVYSFGVVLYELTVGRVPFSADTPFSIIHDHIYTPLPLPREINPRVPEAVERVLLKSLAKDRADRYASVEALGAAFQAAVLHGLAVDAAEIPAPRAIAATTEAPTTRRPEPLPPSVVSLEAGHRKARRWVWGLGGLAFACACAVGLAGLARAAGRQPAATPVATASQAQPANPLASVDAPPTPEPPVPDLPPPGAEGIPQACGLTDPDYGPIGVGAVVVLNRHRPVEGDPFWSPSMESYVGRETMVTELGGLDRVGCPVVRVDADGGYYTWRIRDLGLISVATLGGAEIMPQACGMPVASVDYGPVEVGSRVVLGRHRPVDGDDYWSANMDSYVGREATVTVLDGVDRMGCPGVRVDADAGYFFWRIRDLVLLP
jgi:tRNA A-37 threonylcarbamoyl transferase component Bud32